MAGFNDLDYVIPTGTYNNDLSIDNDYILPEYTGSSDYLDYPGGYYGGSTLSNWGRSTANLGGAITGALSDGIQRQDLNTIGNAFGNWGKDIGATWNDSKLGQLTGELGDYWGDLSVGQQAGTIWGGLQSLGNLYKSYKGFQLAKDQMNFQKDMWNKSWNANKKQFNEAVNSRAESRYNTVDNRNQREDYKKQYSI